MATIAENIQTLRSIKSDIKNAIIQKGGSVTDAFGTYAQAITDLPSGGGGGTEIEDAFVTRTLSEYSNDRVSVVGDGAFASCSKLKSVDIPNCTSVGAEAFGYCQSLAFIGLPLCSYIGKAAFGVCSSLSSIYLPLCEHIGASTFSYCTALTSFNLPKVKYIGAYAFNYCSGLTSINLPNCTEFNYGAFQNCSNLTQVYLNSVSRVTTIYYNTFSYCSNLTSVYVPASLVDAFKTAQYWSSISDKIVAYTGAQLSTEDIL